MARKERDRYFSPLWATRALKEQVPELRGGVLLEPCCGDGRMALELLGAFDQLILNDLAEPPPRVAPALQGMVGHTQGDGLRPQLWELAKPDWVVTNPPFNLATDFARLALQHAKRGVALLLRCTWLEPTQSRAALLQETPPMRVVALSRISFDGQGSDSAPAWWFVWLRGPDGGWQRGGISVVRREAVGQEELPL